MTQIFFPIWFLIIESKYLNWKYEEWPYVIHQIISEDIFCFVIMTCWLCLIIWWKNSEQWFNVNEIKWNLIQLIKKCTYKQTSWNAYMLCIYSNTSLSGLSLLSLVMSAVDTFDESFIYLISLYSPRTIIIICWSKELENWDAQTFSISGCMAPEV